MDLPIPGSPPSTVTEPGTRPPCSTRSSSPTWVAEGAHAAASTSAMGIGTATDGADGLPPAVAGTTRSSTKEPQASQAEQRPAHFGSGEPHSWHRYVVFALAMAAPYGAGCDKANTCSHSRALRCGRDGRAHRLEPRAPR